MTTERESPVGGAMDKAAPASGFTLVEALVAIFILALGFMFVGPMLVGSVESTTLARSKDTAGLAATNQLESLESKFHANPNDADLTIGSHNPIVAEITNPNDSSVINRYNIGWTVASVPDPRPGQVLRAVHVTVTATPIGSGTQNNLDVKQNKAVSISTIFSFKML